jgi:hypothetical protein
MRMLSRARACEHSSHAAMPVAGAPFVWPSCWSIPTREQPRSPRHKLTPFARPAAAVSPRVRAAHSHLAAVRHPADVVAGTRVEVEEDAGAGVFGDSVSSGGSSSSRPASMVEGDQGPQARGARVGGGERKVKYKGHWYSESEIAALEHKARLLKEEVSQALTHVGRMRARMCADSLCCLACACAWCLSSAARVDVCICVSM